LAYRTQTQRPTLQHSWTDVPQMAGSPCGAQCPVTALAVAVPPHPDGHRPEHPILLAVDEEIQELSCGHRGSDSTRSLLYGVTDSCNEPQDAHQYGQRHERHFGASDQTDHECGRRCEAQHGRDR
jgi:hypothetical protein